MYPHYLFACSDTHFLSCNVIVRARPTPPQPWCEGQCSVDGESFLQYDNDNKATPLGDLGKEAHATHVWKDLNQRLEYLGQELRKMLADTKQEMADLSGHPTLQTIMNSKYERGQIVGASWRFNISAEYFILNTMNMSWTPISFEARGIMNDEQFIKDLKVISTADSSHWLKELLKLQKEKPRSTPRTSDVRKHPSTSQLHNEKVFIPVAAVIVIILPFTVGLLVKRCPQGDLTAKTFPERNHQLPKNCSMNCHNPQRKERPMEPIGEFPNQVIELLFQEDEPKM